MVLAFMWVERIVPRWLWRNLSEQQQHLADASSPDSYATIDPVGQPGNLTALWDRSEVSGQVLSSCLMSIIAVSSQLSNGAPTAVQLEGSSTDAEQLVDKDSSLSMYDNKVFSWTEKASGVWVASLEGSEANPWDMVCGRVVVSASVCQCAQLLVDYSKRRGYDRMFKGAVEHRGVEVGGLNPGAHLKTLRYAGAWPVGDRIFHVLSGWRPHQFGNSTNNDELGAVVGSKSVVPGSIEALQIGEQPQVGVQGRLLLAGFTIRPLDSNRGGPQCEVTMVSHVDFGGTLPPSMINFVQANVMPEMLEKIQNLAPKESTVNGDFGRGLAHFQDNKEKEKKANEK